MWDDLGRHHDHERLHRSLSNKAPVQKSEIAKSIPTPKTICKTLIDRCSPTEAWPLSPAGGSEAK